MPATLCIHGLHIVPSGAGISFGDYSNVYASGWDGLDVVVKLASPGLHSDMAVDSILDEADILQYLQPLCGETTPRGCMMPLG